MKHNSKSIRPFIGAKDYELSRNFYRDFGFEEKVLDHNMCLFKLGELGFYLQNSYVKDWVDNTMIFVEVENVDEYWIHILSLNITSKYSSAKLTPIKNYNWGKECFVHDPSGILWHFGEFAK